MEDWSKKFVPGLPPFANKPPICPKPFATVPPSTTLPMATGSYEGWQQPYFMNRGRAGSSGTKPHRHEQFNGLTFSKSVEVPNEEPQIPPPLSRSPITAVARSSTRNDGILVKTEQGIHYEMKWGPKNDPNIDPKRLRRTLSNRISAQKSRMKKLQYINGMEKQVKDLQAEIVVLIPRVESEKEQHKLLQMENSVLKEKISVYEDTTKQSLAVYKELEAVVKWLRELHAAQQKMRMEKEPWMLGWNYIEMDQTPDSSSHEAGPAMEDQGELEPALNFKSLTVDPPKSLM